MPLGFANVRADPRMRVASWINRSNAWKAR
jgi:hypothetical protein